MLEITSKVDVMREPLSADDILAAAAVDEMPQGRLPVEGWSR
jgi:hypothetical protein